MDALPRHLARLLIVAINLVPLAGVLWFGGNVGFLLALFWGENLVFGALTAVRLLMNTGPVPRLFRLPLVAFFMVHFGLFCAGHGIFVRSFFAQGMHGGFELNLITQFRDFAAYYPQFGRSMALIAGMNVAQWLLAWRRDPAFLSGALMQEMNAPYPRLVMLHVTLLFGGFAVLWLGQPLWALVLLVAMKTAMDLGFGEAGRRKAARAAGQAAVSAPA